MLVIYCQSNRFLEEFAKKKKKKPVNASLLLFQNKVAEFLIPIIKWYNDMT